MSPKLRTKIGIATAGTFVVLLGILYAGSAWMVARGVREAEQRMGQLSVERVRSALDEETRHLSAIAGDYSIWDDSYRFVRTLDPAFVASNFSGKTPIVTLAVHLIAYLDEQGTVVFAKAWDLENEVEVPPPVRVGEPFPVPGRFRSDAAGTVRGLVLLEGVPTLAASSPILQSDGSGPSRGRVVVGLRLDGDCVLRLSRMTQLRMRLAPVAALPPGFWPAPYAGPDNTSHPGAGAVSAGHASTRVVPVSANTVSACAVLRDIEGRPAVALRIDALRDLLWHQRHMLRNFAGGLLAAGLFVWLLNILLLRNLVVARLLALSRSVARIGAEGRVSERVPCEGTDELSELAADINGMLASLERTGSDLESARARAEEASRAKGRFLANMSHEIRTPMNGVIGMAEILSRADLAPTEREMAQTIRNSAESLLAVLNDILDSSKIEAGKITLEAVPFDLKAVAAEVAQLHAGAAAARGVRFRFDCPADLPAVVGDSGRIRQILNNLLGNAVKFTEQGEVVLEIAPEPPDPSPGAALSVTASPAARIRCSVRDTGIGIPADRIDRIFECFEQADSSTTRRFGGTGLGLSITKQLLELMGSRIEVESRPGEGSTFRFRLELPVASAGVLPLGGMETAAEVPWDGFPHVLLAEDNAVNRQVALHNLADLGIIVDTAVNGREAVDMAGRFPYDLILMDCLMPEMDGFEATRRIREREGAEAHVPVVAMTASAMEGDRERCLACGMDAYLAKPVRRETLLAVLGGILGTRRAGTPPPVALPCPAPSGERPLLASLGDLYPIDLVRDLARIYLAESQPHVGGLHRAVRSRDGAQITFHAHTLKGMAANFGLDELCAALLDLERWAAAETEPDPARLDRSHALAQALLERTRIRIEEVKTALETGQSGAQPDSMAA